MRVGIIGCGAIAARAHIPAFARAGATLVAVADIDISRAKALAKKFSVPAVYSDYHELLAEDVEMVAICTPPKTHAQIAIDAADKGKHILLEKPMTTSLEDAKRVVNACRLNKIKLCMVHEFRFFPCVQEAKKRISSGKLGNILSIEMISHPQFPMRWTDSTWFYDKWNLLDDMGVHIIDILGYLTDWIPPRTVSAVARDATGNMGFFNQIQAIIELVNSCAVYLNLSYVTGTYEMTGRIFGTAGKIEVDVTNNYLSEIHGYITPIDELSSTIRKSWRTAGAIITKAYFRGSLNYYDVVIPSFLNSIAQGTDPPVGPEEGMWVVDFVQRIKDSVR